MSSDLNSFFEEERKRVFEPGPFFAQRVMAQVAAAPQREAGIWETVPGATKPVFALALLILFAVLGVQLSVRPLEPTHGAIEAYVTKDLSPTETLLIIGAETPLNAAQILEELSLGPGE